MISFKMTLETLIRKCYAAKKSRGKICVCAENGKVELYILRIKKSEMNHEAALRF